MKRTLLSFAIFLGIVCVAGVAFAAGGGDGGSISAKFWKNWGFSMLNFAVFAFVIWRYVLPKIQEYFATRRDTLMADLDEARRLRTEAQEKLDEYSSRLDNLEKERQEIMDDYHKQGQREKERLVASAHKSVEKMRKDAEVLIAAETRRAIASIEQQAVDLAVNMAVTKVESQMNDGTQNQLVDQYVSDLKEMS